MMELNIYRRHDCEKAKGLCVIIDVLRAFTTAAFAFAGGAEEIILVSSLEEAFEKYRQDPNLTLMGEIQGLPIEGFHYGNSPAEIEKLSFRGQSIVQSTSSGTQGAVNCRHVDQMLIASLVVAEATVKRIRELSPQTVSFIVTGVENGDEDLALADYLIEKLKGKTVSIQPFLERVRLSPLGKKFENPAIPECCPRDLELVLQADRFSFAMEVSKVNQNLVARVVK